MLDMKIDMNAIKCGIIAQYLKGYKITDELQEYAYNYIFTKKDNSEIVTVFFYYCNKTKLLKFELTKQGVLFSNTECCWIKTTPKIDILGEDNVMFYIEEKIPLSRFEKKVLSEVTNIVKNKKYSFKMS